MSRHDIGNYLGLVDETVSRLFTKFREKKIIDAERRKIKLLNHALLCQVAEGEAVL
jgi:CRP/FNR family transcriptional regulator